MILLKQLRADAGDIDRACAIGAASEEALAAIGGRVAQAFPPRVGFAPASARLAGREQAGREAAFLAARDAQAERIAVLEAELERLRCRSSATVLGQIVPFVAQAIQASERELAGPCRAKKLARGRFAVVWAARRLSRYSLPQIAAALGGRDHSTIISALRRADQLRGEDPEFRRLTDAVVAFYGGPRATEEEMPCLPL